MVENAVEAEQLGVAGLLEHQCEFAEFEQSAAWPLLIGNSAGTVYSVVRLPLVVGLLAGDSCSAASEIETVADFAANRMMAKEWLPLADATSFRSMRPSVVVVQHSALGFVVMGELV